jgi:hypothetical protein
MSDMEQVVRLLIVVVAVLVGIIVGQVSGILACANGRSLSSAFAAGGVAFGGTVTLAILIANSLGLL